jgi:hypothetical protein
MNIGNDLISGGRYGPLGGDIAEVGVWRVALTPNEIKRLAAGAPCDAVRQLSLAAYMPLDGDIIDRRRNTGVWIDNSGGAVSTFVPIRKLRLVQDADVVAGGGTVTGDASAAGVGAATGIGAATAAAVAASAGTGVALGVGSYTLAPTDGVATAAGAGTAAAIGAATAAAIAAAFALGEALGVGASIGIISAVGNAAGTSEALGYSPSAHAKASRRCTGRRTASSRGSLPGSRRWMSSAAGWPPLPPRTTRRPSHSCSG